MAPPAFLLGPLAGLLFLSRPRTLREWWWAAGGALICVLWALRSSGGLPGQVVRASAAFLTGAFLALVLVGGGTLFRRAFGAVVLAGLALTVWVFAVGLRWADVQGAVAREGWAAYRELINQLQSRGGASTDNVASAVQLLEAMSAQVGTAAALYPSFLVLTALAGLALAWRWYHRLASRPLPPAPGSFREFRFSDHMIWGVVAGLALVLAPLTPGWRTVGANVLVIWGMLYGLRGLAIVRAASTGVPRLVVVAAAIAALFMLPFVLSGLVVLGLADTWLDFRRRFGGPASGGSVP